MHELSSLHDQSLFKYYQHHTSFYYNMSNAVKEILTIDHII